MKKLSDYLNKKQVTEAKKSGNALGITNKYIPPFNTVTYINNMLSFRIGCVVEVAEDGISIKVTSSRFISEEETRKIINEYIDFKQSLNSLMFGQGYSELKIVKEGMYYTVYYIAPEVKSTDMTKNAEKIPTVPTSIDAPDPIAMLPALPPGVYEDLEIIESYKLKNVQLNNKECTVMVNEADDDEEKEMSDDTAKNLYKIMSKKDKTKAAKELEAIVTSKMDLPREYYFAGVRSKDGIESIALRWKYMKRRPGNINVENTRSLINIYTDNISKSDPKEDKEGTLYCWVGDFDKDAMFKLPEKVEELLKSILELLDAKETNDLCIYTIEDPEKKKEDEDEDKDKKKEESDEDIENDESRGEDEK